MPKILIIEDCGHCIYRQLAAPGSIVPEFQCAKTKKGIWNLQTIPDWCPLENYRAGKEGE